MALRANPYSDRWRVRYWREDGYCTQYYPETKEDALEKKEWVLDTVGRDRIEQIKVIGPDV